MHRRSRTFRVFVSSTFSDLKAERNALQDRVFPKLRQLCERNGCRFQAIDLRWGVSEEAALDQQAMNICLQELKRCQDVSPRPNFIVLLGDRYGWQPLPPQIEAKEFDRLMKELSDGDVARLKFDEGTPAIRQGEGNGWYRLDTNALPHGEYVLLPRVAGSPFETFEGWEPEERALLALLRNAVSGAYPDPNAVERKKYFQSATHQEIEAGALALREDDQEPERHVLCWQREFDRKAVEASGDSGRADFIDLQPSLSEMASEVWRSEAAIDDEAYERQQELKRDLRVRLPDANTKVHTNAPWPWEPSEADLDSLCDFFERRLTEIIEAEVAQVKEIDPLDAENQAHFTFAKERARHFVGRADLLQSIGVYLDGDDRHPLIVHGVSGCGKTALMAKAFLRSEFPDSKTAFLRIIGATPGSANIRSLLEDLGRKIDRAVGAETAEVPDDINRFHEWFRERLEQATEDQPIVLFLDALDQLNEADSAHSLSWLPRDLPPHVRVAVSILERPGESAGKVLETAQRGFENSRFLTVQPLGNEDGGQLLDLWLKEGGRDLGETQRATVLDAYAESGLPLWLKLAFEESRHWKSFDQPQEFAADASDLIGQMLDRLQQPEHHGKLLVNRALGYLAAARHGLNEEEMLDVLAADETYWKHFQQSIHHDVPGDVRRLPVILWSRLYADLEAYLSEQQADGTVLLGFYHRLLREAVEEQFLGETDRLQRHHDLASYFLKQPNWIDDDETSGERRPCVRKLTEAPHQAIRSERWDDVIGGEENPGLLCDLRFIEAKCAASLGHELSGDYHAAMEKLPELREEREKDRTARQRCVDYVNALAEYAGKCRAGEDVPLPEPPPACEPSPGLNPDHVVAKAAPTPGNRLRRFAGFYIGNRHVIAEHAGWTLPLAGNYGESGLIFEQAERFMGPIGSLWLQRRPGVPEPPPFPAARAVLEGHSGGVSAVAASADFSRALSASQDDTLRLWDLESGACRAVLEGHSGTVSAVAASADFSRALSAGYDKTLRLWDLESGACRAVLEGHSNWVTAVAASADFSRALSASWDKTLRLWDLESGACRAVLEGHSGFVTAVAASADFSRALSASEDDTLRLWDLESGACRAVLEGHSSGVSAVAASADFSRALSTSYDDTLRLWDLESGACRAVLEGHSGGVSAVAASADFSHALSASYDKTLRLWDLESGACRAVLEGHSGGVSAVAASADFSRALSASGDQTLRLWDLESGACRAVLEGHSGGVSAVAASADFSRALSASGDQTLRLWDLESGACRAVLEGHSSGVSAVAASADFSRALSASYDWTLRLWDLENGACRAELEGHSGTVSAVAASADFSRALSASEDKTLRLWDLENGACRAELEGHSGTVSAVAASADFSRALSASLDKTLRLWDLESGACRAVLEGHSDGVSAVAASADFSRALSASYDQTLRLWDLESGACRAVLEGHSDGVSAVAANADFSRALSASLDKTLRLWDLESGACRAVLEGHSRGVSAVAASADFSRALSASYDDTLRLWDLESGACRATYYAGSTVLSVTADFKRGRVVCGTKDGQVHFLTIMRGNEIVRMDGPVD